MRVKGTGPTDNEIRAYIQRLKEILNSGGRIQRVQVYTVARDPALSIVSSLDDADVEVIADEVRKNTGLPAEAFFGQVPAGRGLMDDGNGS